jgi:two-component system nitrate/nitrite response regulator NarL
VSGHPIRVLVADNHPMYRQAVATALGRMDELEVVAEREDGRGALEAVRELRPDVAVLDLSMPEPDGMQVLQAITREQLPTRVMFLSANAESGVVYAALGAGASAYLSKDSPAQEVCQAVITVGRGGTVLPAEVHAGIAAEIRMRVGNGGPALTDREREVLALIAEGRSVRDVGGALHISVGTVKSDLQAIFQKMGVSSRTAAVAEAIRRGIIE